MLVLALDTTTAAGSAAVAEDGNVVELAPIDPSAPVATQVPGVLAALLDRQRMALADIDVFAVATGPGSFTGLRIGIAAMQGLALARHKPLIGVSAFDALAALAAAPRVGVWIDAWRGEVYVAWYEQGRQVGAAAVLPADAALQDMPPGAVPDGIVFVGDGAVKYRPRIPHPVIDPTPLLAGAVAREAWARARRGETPPPHAIRPLYVRRPDAELARERKPSA